MFIHLHPNTTCNTTKSILEKQAKLRHIIIRFWNEANIGHLHMNLLEKETLAMTLHVLSQLQYFKYLRNEPACIGN